MEISRINEIKEHLRCHINSNYIMNANNVWSNHDTARKDLDDILKLLIELTEHDLYEPITKEYVLKLGYVKYNDINSYERDTYFFNVDSKRRFTLSYRNDKWTIGLIQVFTKFDLKQLTNIKKKHLESC